LFGRLRLDIREERAEIAVKEKEAEQDRRGEARSLGLRTIR